MLGKDGNSRLRQSERAKKTEENKQQKDYHLVHRGRAQNVVRLQFVKRIAVRFTLDYTAFKCGVIVVT